MNANRKHADMNMKVANNVILCTGVAFLYMYIATFRLCR